MLIVKAQCTLIISIMLIVKAQYTLVVHKIIFIKIFLKRNLPHVGMVQCMNALADKVQKTRHAMHTVICTPYQGHIIQQPSLHK